MRRFPCNSCRREAAERMVNMPQNLLKYLLYYLTAINLVTFLVYGVDKLRAKRGAWRIPEKTLFLLPILGGSVGAIAGMKVFHHKTKHWYFKYGLPLILILQLALVVWLKIR